jgi:hypothetical protein
LIFFYIAKLKLFYKLTLLSANGTNFLQKINGGGPAPSTHPGIATLADPLFRKRERGLIAFYFHLYITDEL